MILIIIVIVIELTFVPFQQLRHSLLVHSWGNRKSREFCDPVLLSSCDTDNTKKVDYTFEELPNLYSIFFLVSFFLSCVVGSRRKFELQFEEDQHRKYTGCSFGVFIVNFGHISHLYSSVFIVNFEHVIAGCYYFVISNYSS